MGINKVNNFDLIRLIAAIQVMVCHSISHLKININPIFNFIYFFPGVPIFFTISGFLLANSLYQNSNLKKYFINRCFRIFPALWGCFLITIFFLLHEGSINISTFITIPFYEWVFCQLTIFQFYTPPFLRTFLTPNGSLWTIGVEFQFYFLLPIIYYLSKISNRIGAIFAILGIYLLSVVVSYWYRYTNQEVLFAKLIHVTVLPYLQFFLMGFISFIFWPKLKTFLVNKFLVWFAIYFIFVYILFEKLHIYELSYTPNIFGWLGYVILSLLTLSMAFTKNGLSSKMLKGIDISYGIYLYHMIVINFMISNHISNSPLILVIIITVILAIMSWTLIESPFLKYKNKFIVNI